MKLSVAAFAASALPVTLAQSCVSLAGSTVCPAFTNSSISTTGPTLLGNFPFLSNVTSRQTFDKELSSFVQQGYVQQKYQNLLGCTNVNLGNTSEYYARYTISTICNAIVQISIQPCGLSAEQAPPLCADVCAEQATSEETIANNPRLCGTPKSSYLDQIRADFTYCALPADSLTGSCVAGDANEPDECGFSQNLGGLCSYCGASSPNSTDSCCVSANVDKRCAGVTLPAFSTLPPLFTATATSTSAPGSSATSAKASSTAAASSGSSLSGGAIAGIVIGSIIGAALLLGLLVLACICLKRRKTRSQGSPFSQRSGARTDPFTDKTQPPPGGRVARMTALEGSSSDGRGGLDPMLAAEKRRYGANSDSDPLSSSSARAPVASRRQGSLSSNSALGVLGGVTTGDETTSPSNAGGQYSSPGDWNSGQSEQLPFFKDYYSSGEIHTHDKVSVLWAYQPRATDEFELERGDMLRVVGIWDDGWATGIRISDRAEDFDGKHKEQRDSGISQAEGGKSPLEGGEVKAFPLVCVCLPEHWKKTIEGDGSTDSTSPPPAHNQEPFGQF